MSYKALVVNYSRVTYSRHSVSDSSKHGRKLVRLSPLRVALMLDALVFCSVIVVPFDWYCTSVL